MSCSWSHQAACEINKVISVVPGARTEFSPAHTPGVVLLCCWRGEEQFKKKTVTTNSTELCQGCSCFLLLGRMGEPLENPHRKGSSVLWSHSLLQDLKCDDPWGIGDHLRNWLPIKVICSSFWIAKSSCLTVGRAGQIELCNPCSPGSDLLLQPDCGFLGTSLELLCPFRFFEEMLVVMSVQRSPRLCGYLTNSARQYKPSDADQSKPRCYILY